MPEKLNNSKNGEKQPYDPNSGEYLEKEASEVFNFYARKFGANKNEHPIGFPTPRYPLEYIHDYFNNEIDWNNISVKDDKIHFLLDTNSSKKRYLIFRELLGYSEKNWQELQNQIINNANKFKVFVDKGYDEWGFRAKIYMPIKFANSDKQLIIKTCWLIAENQIPRFITAWYDPNFERNIRDEI